MGLNVDEHLIEIEPRPGEQTLRTEDIAERIGREGPRLALVLLPGVQYLSGQLLELAPLIGAARAAGAAVGLDLAHAIGNVPLALHDWNADFAVWCSYKYLNAGPGAVGGCFVHERHAQSARSAPLRRMVGTRQGRALRDGAALRSHCGRGRLADQQSSGAVHGPASRLAWRCSKGRASIRLREKSLALTALPAALDRGALAGRRRYRDASRRGGARQSAEPADAASADRAPNAATSASPTTAWSATGANPIRCACRPHRSTTRFRTCSRRVRVPGAHAAKPVDEPAERCRSASSAPDRPARCSPFSFNGADSR